MASRKTVALSTQRHENVVRDHCEPIACDVRTRAVLYDLDAAAEALRRVPRRVRWGR